ncbi:recombinase family protein [Butyrivibrio sp. WCD3002]|uniref:recombinase family protein n=1 Tax=Butyrivibrio sp. WCD3002 TaxID=1280676 RepID=UPI0004179AFC|nr:recombinase family protein [Butyrivibrio sp. WCD3002]
MSYASEIHRKINNCEDPLNAVIYARVSTENDSQKESCGHQVALAEAFLSKHPNIRLLETYVDDGITAVLANNRPQYKLMRQRIAKGDVDIIITKALSRLNRNQSNALSLRDLLIEHETTVFTLEDNHLNDFEDMNCDMMHSVQSVMNEHYSRSLSASLHRYNDVRYNSKELAARNITFGYGWNKDAKDVFIKEEEAEIIKWLFKHYVYQNETPASLRRALKAKGISVCERTVINYITDERYIGKFYINKWGSKFRPGRGAKKFKNDKIDWVLVERPDLQIIDEQLFELAQRIRQARISINNIPTSKEATQARFRGKYKFSNKIFCPECGKAYHFDYADVHKTIPIYRIRSHSNCTNKNNRIDEEVIEDITRQALKHTYKNKESIISIFESEIAKVVKESQNNVSEVQNLKKKKSTYEKKFNNLMDFLSEGGLSVQAKASIKDKLNAITCEIDDLDRMIEASENSVLDESYVEEKLIAIREALNELCEFTVIDRSRILNYVDRIEIPSDGTVEICFKTGHLIMFDSAKTCYNPIESNSNSNSVKMCTKHGRYS